MGYCLSLCGIKPNDRGHSSCDILSAIRKEFVCFKISTVFATADLGNAEGIETLRSDLVKVAEEFVFRFRICDKGGCGCGILGNKLIDNLLTYLESRWANSGSEPR